MSQSITHGRHCGCGACARQDWSEPHLAPCGMHGSSCPPRYDPWGVAGDPVGLMSQVDSEYLEFVRDHPPGRKTPIVVVRSKSSGVVLGSIAWFGRWRQFCFHPKADTVFSIGCMNDIAYVIRDLHNERRGT
jgi:hypothetical protein